MSGKVVVYATPGPSPPTFSGFCKKEHMHYKLWQCTINLT